MTAPNPSQPLKRLLVLLSACTLILAACGCEPEAINTSSGIVGAFTGRHWEPSPVSIRVYPSTRLIQESGQAILEARFELRDEMGDSLKSSGTFLIELFSVDESQGGVPRRLLYKWNTEVLSLDQQREHYDPITRGYLFNLGIDDLSIAKEATLLRVSFTPVGRPRLSAEAVIRSGW